jgi:DNA polymerase III delta prime subunit
MENLTPADIAAVTDRNRGYDGGMFGGDWSIIILFLILTMFGGGNWNGRGNAVTEADLCNANSFSELKAGVARNNDAINNMYTGIQNGLSNFGYETLRNFSNVIAELKSCCCELARGIDGINYNGAINTSNIIQANEHGVQKILDAICGNRMQDMQNQINQLQLQAALCGVVRYPNATTFTAGANPFFGGGCCNPCNI